MPTAFHWVSWIRCGGLTGGTVTDWRVGDALAELAARATEIGAAFGQVGQDLSGQAGAMR
jgi:hypothetical protein